jgi:hypothetical protein
MKFETEKKYLLRRWHALSDASKQMLARSSESELFCSCYGERSTGNGSMGRRDDLTEEAP